MTGDAIRTGVGIDIGIGIVTRGAARRRPLVPGGGKICIRGKVISIRRE